MLEIPGWILIAFALIVIGRVLMKKGKTVSSEVEQSKVYHATSKEDDAKLYELTVKMKLQAEGILNRSTEPVSSGWIYADELSNTVLEFLKVSGWSR